MPAAGPTAGQAVASFIVVFGNSPDIQTRAQAMLEQLHPSPDWTDAEVGQVRENLEAVGALAKVDHRGRPPIQVVPCDANDRPGSVVTVRLHG